MLRLDQLIVEIDKALRTVGGVVSSSRPNPALKTAGNTLDDASRRHSAGLMRVNHVGEVCAQALYNAQGRFAKSDAMRGLFAQGGREEEEHLAWTAERLRELGSRTSILNPVWYLSAYGVGVLATRLGDARSLGFVVETERQVAAHLAGHLAILPEQDEKSRVIVEQMRIDEMMHGAAAQSLGAEDVPVPVQKVMRIMAKIMTKIAYYF